MTLVYLSPPVAWAARPSELSELSLEQLLELEVTSVSKKSEKRAAAADALYVLTGDDIRRSGVTTIPDALRLVPGVQVARITSNQWAIGIRGFANRLSRAVLVLIDGRTVYNPLFAGTYWELQDTVLEDIDRIEVIRGPGGALWGANAFNGVINIITKDSAATQGGLLLGRGGNEEQGTGTFRYGGRLGDRLTYRIYGKYTNRDGGGTDERDDYDDWDMVRGGFRVDWKPRTNDSLTLQGDVYDADLGTRVAVADFSPPFQRVIDGPARASGANALGRWSHTFSPSSDVAVQLYYDHTFRRDLNFREERNTFDFDAQHRFALPWRQEIVWGLGYRLTGDNTGGRVEGVGFDPASRTDHLVSGFVQDEITLVPQLLHLTIGSKFEHNDYSGFEYQPNARLLFTPFDAHTFWASVGRSVRTPSRFEDDLRLTVAPPFNVSASQPGGCFDPLDPSMAGACIFPRVVGDSHFKSETLLAAQGGYRVQLLSSLFIDVVGFYQDYDDLLSLEPGTTFSESSPAPPHVIFPFRFDNNQYGESYGVEVAPDWFVLPRWRLHGGYSFLTIDLHRRSGTGDPRDRSAQTTETSSPEHQFFVRSEIDLPWNLELDSNVRYVDVLSGQGVRSYVTFDVRLAAQLTEQLEVAAVGQNLWDTEHREFAGGTRVERGAYGQVRYTW